MKQPSPKLKKVIDELQTLLVAENGTTKKTLTPDEVKAALEILQSFSSDTQFLIIPYLLRFTIGSPESISRAAANIVEEQLQIISLLHLLQLQDRLRGSRWGFTPLLSLWNGIKFDDLKRFEQSHPRLVSLASFSPSGYVREAAVKYLHSLNSGFELSYLLIRLTDWVPAVAAQAKMAIEARFREDYWPHFIENLLLIELLGKKKRGSSPDSLASTVFAKIDCVLKSPEHRSLLLKGLTSPKWATRRMCLKMLKSIRAEAFEAEGDAATKLDKARTDARQVIDAVLAEKDITNRLLIFEFASDLSIAEQIGLMVRLGKDTGPSIRRNALEILCQINSESSQSHLEKGLLDRSPLVREFARYKLIQGKGTFDFRQFYLDKLESKPSVKIISCALAGLGEVGDEKDVDVLLPFFKHPQVGVRRFATLALGKLEPAGHDDIFLEMLDQSSIGLSRAAASIISELPEPVNGATLFQIFDQSERKHVKLHAVRLFNSLPKWQRISYLLQAATAHQSEVKKMAVTYVESWEQQYRTTFQYSLPTDAEASIFRHSFKDHDHNLTPQVKKTLEACLALCSSAI